MNRKIILLPLTIAAAFVMASCTNGGGDNTSTAPTSSATPTPSTSEGNKESSNVTPESSSEAGGESSSESSEVLKASITLDKTNVTLKVGGKELVTKTVSNSENQNVIWTSENETIATVKAGLITGVAAGSTKVVATLEADPTVKAEVNVTVNDIEKTAIGSITTAQNGVTLYGTIVAKDNLNGFIIDDGTGAVYVYSKDDLLSSGNFGIGDYVAVTGDIFSYFTQMFQMGSYNPTDKSTHATLKVAAGVGAKPTLKTPVELTSSITSGWKQTASPILPKDVVPYTFTSTATVASGKTSFKIDGETINIGTYNCPFTFLNGVRYTVTAYPAGYTEHGSTSILMFVTNAVPTYEAVESITLSETTGSLKVGAGMQLNATIAPAGANPAVTWISDNEEVATVTSSGYVTGVAEGVAHITAKSVADETKVATATITVAGTADKAVYKLVTSIDEVREGSKLVIANAASGTVKTLVNTIQNSYYLNVGEDEVTDEKLGDEFNGTVFTLEKGDTDGTFKFHDADADNYLYAYTSGTHYTVINSSSSNAKNGTMDWTVAASSTTGAFTMKAGSVYLEYYKTSKFEEYCGYSEAKPLYFFAESRA